MRPESVTYRDDLDGLSAAHLDGFFVGWPNPPSSETHLAVLRGSSHVGLAWSGDALVGFISAVSDGVLCAYIPLLEVRPEAQAFGVGSELVRRLLARLDHLYMVDLVCDPDLVPFYERFGLRQVTAMAHRNYDRQSGH